MKCIIALGAEKLGALEMLRELHSDNEPQKDNLHSASGIYGMIDRYISTLA